MLWRRDGGKKKWIVFLLFTGFRFGDVPVVKLKSSLTEEYENENEYEKSIYFCWHHAVGRDGREKKC